MNIRATIEYPAMNPIAKASPYHLTATGPSENITGSAFQYIISSIDRKISPLPTKNTDPRPVVSGRGL